MRQMVINEPPSSYFYDTPKLVLNPEIPGYVHGFISCSAVVASKALANQLGKELPFEAKFLVSNLAGLGSVFFLYNLVDDTHKNTVLWGGALTLAVQALYEVFLSYQKKIGEAETNVINLDFIVKNNRLYLHNQNISLQQMIDIVNSEIQNKPVQLSIKFDTNQPTEERIAEAVRETVDYLIARHGNRISFSLAYENISAELLGNYYWP